MIHVRENPSVNLNVRNIIYGKLDAVLQEQEIILHSNTGAGSKLTELANELKKIEEQRRSEPDAASKCRAP